MYLPFGIKERDKINNWNEEFAFNKTAAIPFRCWIYSRYLILIRNAGEGHFSILKPTYKNFLQLTISVVTKAFHSTPESLSHSPSLANELCPHNLHTWWCVIIHYNSSGCQFHRAYCDVGPQIFAGAKTDPFASLPTHRHIVAPPRCCLGHKTLSNPAIPCGHLSK